VAAYAITFYSSNKVDNKQKCSKTQKMKKRKKGMQSEEMSCKEGIQQILSIRFRYGFFLFDFFLSSSFFCCLFSKLA